MAQEIKSLFLVESGSRQPLQIGQVVISETGFPEEHQVRATAAELAKELEYWIYRFAGYNKLFDAVGKGGRVAEIGVHVGDNASRILRRAEPDELFLVDPWRRSEEKKHQGSRFDARCQADETENRYQFVRRRFAENGNVRVFREFSSEWLKKQEDESLDWVYIDGDHTEQAVYQDLVDAFRVVKKGGFITGDDYEKQGWWDWGVKKAVDGFLGEYCDELSVVYLREPFVLHKV